MLRNNKMTCSLHTHSEQPTTLKALWGRIVPFGAEGRFIVITHTNHISGCLFCVLVSENGKVAVEYNHTQEEPTDSLTEEELKGLVQVRPADV